MISPLLVASTGARTTLLALADTRRSWAPTTPTPRIPDQVPSWRGPAVCPFTGRRRFRCFARLRPLGLFNKQIIVRSLISHLFQTGIPTGSVTPEILSAEQMRNDKT